jgi:hypothetical protein
MSAAGGFFPGARIATPGHPKCGRSAVPLVTPRPMTVPAGSPARCRSRARSAQPRMLPRRASAEQAHVVSLAAVSLSPLRPAGKLRV